MYCVQVENASVIVGNSQCRLCLHHMCYVYFLLCVISVLSILIVLDHE